MSTQPKTTAYRALVLSTLAFTASFAAWMLNGVLASYLAANEIFAWSPSDIGWLMALPVLVGSALRFPAWKAAERWGSKPILGGLMIASSVPMFFLSRADGFWSFALCSLGFGLVGGVFSVGLSYVASWFSVDDQKFAVGVFGIGNAGAALTPLAGPSLLNYLTHGQTQLEGWRHLPLGVAGLLLGLGILFLLFAPHLTPIPSSQKNQPTSSYLRDLRVWRLGLYYVLVFGGFVATSQWLVYYFESVYWVTVVQAGLLTAAICLPSGLIRAVGGWMSNRWGSRVIMYGVLVFSSVISLLLTFPRMEMHLPAQGVTARAAGVVEQVSSHEIVVSGQTYSLAPKLETRLLRDQGNLILPSKENWHEPMVSVGTQVVPKQLLAAGTTRVFFQANLWVFALLVFALGLVWGIGRAAVYRHIPDYFPQQVGEVGAVVATIGGIGGFLFLLVFGYAFELTGIWTSSWALVFLLSASSLLLMHWVIERMTKRPLGFETKYADSSRVLPGDRLAPLFEFNERFRIGVQDMDDQHRRLLELVSKLDEVIQRNRDPREFRTVIVDLEQYIQIHFAAEEIYMERIGFPKILQHKKSHGDFTREVGNFRRRVGGGETRAMDELLDYLKSWVIGHIMVMDKEYAAFSGTNQSTTTSTIN